MHRTRSKFARLTLLIAGVWLVWLLVPIAPVVGVVLTLFSAFILVVVLISFAVGRIWPTNIVEQLVVLVLFVLALVLFPTGGIVFEINGVVVSTALSDWGGEHEEYWAARGVDVDYMGVGCLAPERLAELSKTENFSVCPLWEDAQYSWVPLDAVTRYYAVTAQVADAHREAYITATWDKPLWQCFTAEHEYEDALTCFAVRNASIEVQEPQ